MTVAHVIMSDRGSGLIQWREVPSEIEVAAALDRVLAHPMELARVSEKDIRLCLPLLDSAFHRLMIHSVCQFYGVRSRSKCLHLSPRSNSF